MTIGELIEALAAYPRDAVVYVQSAPDGTPVEPEPRYQDYEPARGVHL